jgi:hypothetical protein
MGVEYELKSPVTIGEKTLAVLKLEEAPAWELVRNEVSFSEEALSSAKGMLALVTACAVDASDLEVSRLRIRDLTGAVNVCSDFFD